MLPILTAPTAAGKSALALRLARQLPLEIVAADAFTVYRGLDIGTAKPTPAEQQEVPHHLLDVADVTDAFDVARWLRLAEQAITDILSRDNVPLIVGGSGFYFKALMRGLPLTPPSDPQARATLEAELQERGLDALLAEIAARNPPEAARMERNPRRVVRALEIYRRTGQLSRRVRLQRARPPLPGVRVQSAGSGTRIRQRVQAMLGAGWPQEAAWLADQIAPDQPATVWQVLGYREALAVARQQLSR